MRNVMIHFTISSNHFVGIAECRDVKEHEFAVITCGITSISNFIKIPIQYLVFTCVQMDVTGTGLVKLACKIFCGLFN